MCCSVYLGGQHSTQNWKVDFQIAVKQEWFTNWHIFLFISYFYKLGYLMQQKRQVIYITIQRNFDPNMLSQWTFFYFWMGVASCNNNNPWKIWHNLKVLQQYNKWNTMKVWVSLVAKINCHSDMKQIAVCIFSDFFISTLNDRNSVNNTKIHFIFCELLFLIKT